MSRPKTQPIEHLGRQHSCGADEWRWYDDSWECVPCRRKRWRANNPPGKERKRFLRRRYGMTVEDFDAMLAAQAGRCDICTEPMTGKNDPSVDHCHQTNVVRSLLCTHCNRLLGGASDNPARLVAALDYLIRHHPERHSS